jgi:hypothetical protein
MAAAFAHRYVIVFPESWDAPRPSWPIEIRDGFLAISGVVDAVFPDATSAWSRGALPMSEARRRTIEVLTSLPTQKQADSTFAALVAAARALGRRLGAERVTVARWPVELSVV